MSTVDDAYTAGFFDGEGCILIRPNGAPPRPHTFQLVVQIGNTNIEVLEFVASVYGGAVHAFKPTKDKQLYQWIATGHVAAEFLDSILPHLIVKEAQAKIALQFPFWKQGKPLTEEIMTKREHLFKELLTERHTNG